MPKYSKDQVQEQYQRLPQVLKEAMFSVDLAEQMFELGKKFGLTIEKTGYIAEETGYVILGLTHPKDFVRALTTRLEVSEDQARVIASDVNHKIFFPLRETLKVAHQFEMTVDELQTFEAPIPSIQPQGLRMPPSISRPEEIPQTTISSQGSPLINEVSRMRKPAELPPRPVEKKSDTPPHAPQPTKPTASVPVPAKSSLPDLQKPAPLPANQPAPKPPMTIPIAPLPSVPPKPTPPAAVSPSTPPASPPSPTPAAPTVPAQTSAQPASAAPGSQSDEAGQKSELSGLEPIDLRAYARPPVPPPDVPGKIPPIDLRDKQKGSGTPADLWLRPTRTQAQSGQPAGARKWSAMSETERNRIINEVASLGKPAAAEPAGTAKTAPPSPPGTPGPAAVTPSAPAQSPAESKTELPATATPPAPTTATPISEQSMPKNAIMTPPPASSAPQDSGFVASTQTTPPPPPGIKLPDPYREPIE